MNPKQPPIPAMNTMKSNTNIEFEIEGGVYNGYYTRAQCYKVCMSFPTKAAAIETLENMQVKIELMLESMRINLSNDASANSKITSTTDTVPDTKH
jgi:hypothetical protein